MDALELQLQTLLQRYAQIAQELQSKSKGNPERMTRGRIEVKASRGKSYYYWTTEDKEHRPVKVRLRAPLPKWVAAFVQQAYEHKVCLLVESRLRMLKPLVTKYHADEIQQLYLSMHPARQVLVRPVEMTAEQWQEMPFSGNRYREEEKVFQTKRGEMVRSKSEREIANYLYANRISYHYEKPLRVGAHIFYPDFTLFQPEMQKEVYWEHNGMMDDPQYAARAFRKMQMYEENGFLRGRDLIFTYETRQFHLTESWLDVLLAPFRTESNGSEAQQS